MREQTKEMVVGGANSSIKVISYEDTSVGLKINDSHVTLYKKDIHQLIVNLFWAYERYDLDDK